MVEVIHANVREAIEEHNRQFMSMFKNADGAGLAALYTEDAIMMPPGMDFVRGKEAIGKTLEGLRTMIPEVVFIVEEVGSQGDWAVEMSTYKMLGPESQELDHGKYIVVWKFENGDWKMHRDIFNSSVPVR